MNERSEHPYLMYDSIQATPELLAQCMEPAIRGRVEALAKTIRMRRIRRLVLTGCGTSLMIAQCCVHFLTAWTDLDAVAESAFELQHYPTVRLREGDAIIGFSHTGGTKAVVDFIQGCRAKGYLTAGFLEVAGSRLDAAAEISVIGPGGKDGATPKTRSFSTGILLGAMLALCLGDRERPEVWAALEHLPEQARQVLTRAETPMKTLAKDWLSREHFVLVGSGTNFIAAREGSLKLLEAANVPALGIQIEELAHGNELYLDESWGVLFLAPQNCKGRERMEQDLAGVACAGPDIALITAGDTGTPILPAKAGRIIPLEEATDELLSIFLLILPIQLFAYYTTLFRGKHPDLASAVRPAMAEAIQKFHPPGYH